MTVTNPKSIDLQTRPPERQNLTFHNLGSQNHSPWRPDGNNRFWLVVSKERGSSFLGNPPFLPLALRKSPWQPVSLKGSYKWRTDSTLLSASHPTYHSSSFPCFLSHSGTLSLSLCGNWCVVICFLGYCDGFSELDSWIGVDWRSELCDLSALLWCFL